MSGEVVVLSPRGISVGNSGAPVLFSETLRQNQKINRTGTSLLDVIETLLEHEYPPSQNPGPDMTCDQLVQPQQDSFPE